MPHPERRTISILCKFSSLTISLHLSYMGMYFIIYIMSQGMLRGRTYIYEFIYMNTTM